MAELTTGGLRFSTKESGAQCVTITGVSKMLTWCVVSLVFPVPLPLNAVHDTVRGLTPSGWMMSVAVEEKRRYFIALIVAGEWLSAPIARMQV